MTDALTQFFILLVERSLMAMPLAAIAYVLRCLPRVPKWMGMTLWLLVAARLLLPWSLPSSWSAFNLVDAPVIDGGICASASESSTPNALHYRQSSASVPSKADSAQTAETTAYSRQTADDGAVQKQTSRPALSVFLPIAAYIWLAGVIVLLGKALFGYAEFRRLLAASIPLRDNIRLCDGIETGFTVGLLHPRIYMPSSLKDKEPQFSQVLAHEQAHLQRGDHFWKLLALVLRSFYWFNPVLWLAFNLFCEDMELACDELVCRGMTHAERIDYSQTLRDQTLQEAYRSETDILSLNAAVCPLAFGEICLKKRIKAVLNYRKPTLLVLASAAVLYAAAAVLFLTDSSVVPCDFNEYSSDKISDVYTYYRPDDRRIEWNVIDLNSYGDELLKRLRSLKGTRIALPDGRTPICELTVWGSGMEKIQIQTFDHNSSLTEIKWG